MQFYIKKLFCISCTSIRRTTKSHHFLALLPKKKLLWTSCTSICRTNLDSSWTSLAPWNYLVFLFISCSLNVACCVILTRFLGPFNIVVSRLKHLKFRQIYVRYIHMKKNIYFRQYWASKNPKRLEATEMLFYSRKLTIIWTEYVSNDRVLRKIKPKIILLLRIRKWRLKFLRPIMRKESIEKLTNIGYIEEQRKVPNTLPNELDQMVGRTGIRWDNKKKYLTKIYKENL